MCFVVYNLGDIAGKHLAVRLQWPGKYRRRRRVWRTVWQNGFSWPQPPPRPARGSCSRWPWPGSRSSRFCSTATSFQRRGTRRSRSRPNTGKTPRLWRGPVPLTFLFLKVPLLHGPAVRVERLRRQHRVHVRSQSGESEVPGGDGGDPGGRLGRGVRPRVRS